MMTVEVSGEVDVVVKMAVVVMVVEVLAVVVK